MPRTKKKSAASKSILPLVLMVVGGLLIVGAVGWMIYAAAQPQPTPQAVVDPAANGYPAVGRITVADSKAAYDLGSVIFMDVRDATAYAESHIAGALSMPEAVLPDRLGELDPNAWIITYCT